MYADKLLGGVITYGAYSYRFIAFPFDGMTATIKKWVMGLLKMQDGNRDTSHSHRRLYFGLTEDTNWHQAWCMTMWIR